MKWMLPGTVLQIPRENADGVEEVFSSIFLAGGIVLSQVASITGLEPYTIQNWVKRGFLPPPVHKKYTMHQLCRIIHINMLKSVLPLESVCSLLGYINGALDSVDDDIIDDATLYFLFVRLAARAKQLDDPAEWERAMQQALAEYEEPVLGAKMRIRKALQVMLTAWVAGRMRTEAEKMLSALRK